MSIPVRRASALSAAAALLAGGLIALLPVAPAGAVTVGTDAELRAAFTNVAETSITLSADITITCDGDNQIERIGDQADIVVDGAGHTISYACNDGNETVFVTDDVDATVTLRNLTVNDTGSGYAVTSVDGPLVLENVTTHGWINVFRGDHITMSGSAVLDAVGTAVDPDEGATITGSTLAGNDTGLQADGPVIITNTTISGSSDTGLFLRDAQATVTHVTLVDNTTHLWVSGGTFEATAVAFGASTGTPCIDGGGSAAFSSGGHNIAAGACSFGGTTDQADLGTAALSLGALAGAGPVHTPGAGSVLIDAIPAADCAVATDQLGTSRPQGSGCDVGAVEIVPAGPAPTPPATPTPATPRFTG